MAAPSGHPRPCAGPQTPGDQLGEEVGLGCFLWAASEPAPQLDPEPQGLGFLTSPKFGIRLSLQDPHCRGGARRLRALRLTRGPQIQPRTPGLDQPLFSLRQRAYCSGTPGTKPEAQYWSASPPRASRLALLTCSAAAGAGVAAGRLQARRGVAAAPGPPCAKRSTPPPVQASCARSRCHSVLCSPTHRRPLQAGDPVFTRAMTRRTVEHCNRTVPSAGGEVPAGADGAAVRSSETFALRTTPPCGQTLARSDEELTRSGTPQT